MKEWLVVAKKMTKMDRWMMGLDELSARFGVALVETWDGARILDGKNGKALGTTLVYVCGLYTAHKPRTGKTKDYKPQVARDVHGFVSALNHLSDEYGVRLELRSSPMMLADVETMEPLGRLISKDEGYGFEELHTV